MSRITDIAATDFLSVGAFEDFAKVGREECWENTQALGAMAAGLTAALEKVPAYDPRTGRSQITRASLAAAREVGGYFRRAATSQTSCAAEIASAWVVFHAQILGPAQTEANQPPPPSGANGPFRGIPTPTGGPQRTTK